MKTALYTGAAGCGKTFKAVTEAKSFVITVPCRQLAYEIYWDYPDLVSRIETGEVHMGDHGGNDVCVFENLPDEVIVQQTLIVDEAHYLNDTERGAPLFRKILANKSAGKQIVLLTATDTLSDEVKRILDVEETELRPFRPMPEKVELNKAEFCRKVSNGMTSIVFTKRVPVRDHVEYYADAFGVDDADIGVLSANTPTFERVKTQLDFKSGALQIVIASNVLAQGLNFPAQGVLIEYNEWDTWEIITQKIGRVARPLFGINRGYYCLSEMPERCKSQGLPIALEHKARKYARPSGTVIDINGWGFMQHEVPKDLLMYSEFKYARRFLEALAARTGGLEPAERAALRFLEGQSQQLTQLLLTRKAMKQTLAHVEA